jgi:hypothetical protein
LACLCYRFWNCSSFPFSRSAIAPFLGAILTDGRPWNLLAKRSVRQKEVQQESKIIDGAAFEDISWECFAAITRNIDSN